MSKRLLWVDSLRGLLIVLVVIGHCIQDTDIDYTHNYFWNLIYSFHMPVFMSISGYVSYRKSLEIKTLRKKIVELLLPFFTWTLVFNLFSPSLLSKIHEILLHPDMSFWFLWVLFFIILLFLLADIMSRLLKIKQEYSVLFFTVGLSVIMIFFNFRLLGFQFISYYFIFYSLGFYFRKYPNIVTCNKYILIVIGFIWLLGASFWNMHELPFFLKGIPHIPVSLLQYMYRILVALLATYFFIGISPKILNRSNLLNKILVYLGTWTLGIYIVHLGIPFNKIFKNYDFILNNTLLYFVIRLLITIAIVKIISLWNISSFILLGKPLNKK